MKKASRVLWAVLLSVHAGPSWASSSDKSMKSESLRPVVLWGAGLTLVGLTLDRTIQNDIRSEHFIAKTLDHGDYARKGTVMELLGQTQVPLVLSGVLYGGGRWGRNERLERVGRSGAGALLLSGTAVIGLKTLFGRSRPYVDHDADTFHVFHGAAAKNASFPSGHTTTVFTLAAVVADEYDSRLVDSLAYGLATAVAVGRLYQDQHWASDVVAGAALGIATGKAVRRWDKAGRGGALRTDGRGVYWAWAF
ncbi:MAG TPA: phosphatase PAP2 family protein [Elusimicrobiota bacterium]|nr:phosphatase PAP2 family protein [Elusimicrobiota bacterium]HND63489.1 phosphatase PAP2 family protein [Elusimicrobiota bacterium]